MASSPLPCPLTHRLINGGREGERPGTPVKTKDAVVVRGASEAGEAEPLAVRPGRRAAGKAAGMHGGKDGMTDKDRHTEQGRAGGEGR